MAKKQGQISTPSSSACSPSHLTKRPMRTMLWLCLKVIIVHIKPVSIQHLNTQNTGQQKLSHNYFMGFQQETHSCWTCKAKSSSLPTSLFLNLNTQEKSWQRHTHGCSKPNVRCWHCPTCKGPSIYYVIQIRGPKRPPPCNIVINREDPPPCNTVINFNDPPYVIS